MVWFTLNGQRMELTRAVAESRLGGTVPEPIHTHAVEINGVWWPVQQAFEVATGVPRSQFISHTARRHLAAAGFEVRGHIEPRFPPSGSATDAKERTRSTHVPISPAERTAEWHAEALVQAAVVGALAAGGWHILSVANTASKEHGIDIVAELDGVTTGVEVKGYPSRNYADPARAEEVKPTSPSTQAVHWFAQAVLAAMRLRGKRPTWVSAIALPNFDRYRRLYEETATSLEAADIAVWWVHSDGRVER